MRTTRVSVFFFSMIKEPFLWERQRQRAKSYSIWIAALHFSFSPHYHHLEIQKCADKSPYAHRCPILAQLHSPRCLLHQHILCFPIYIDIEPDKTTSLSSKKLCSLSFPFIRSTSIMAHSAAVKTMPSRTSQVHGGAGAKIDPNPSSFNLREFVVDDDAANFNSTAWPSADQQSFVTAQREALEAYNIEKALRLSKATAAEESKRRTAAAAAIDATISISNASPSGSTRFVIAPVSEPQASSTATGRSSHTHSQPIAIKKAPASLPPTSDDAAAFSLARSWQVDALQVPLLEYKQPAVTTTTTSISASSSSSPNMSPKSKLSSTSHSSSSSSSSHDKKASAPVSVSPKQRSQNISLSTSSFVDTASVPSHSRVTPHSNTVHSSAQSHRIEQRTLSKRDPEPTSNSSSSRPAVNSDVTNTTPKRPRTERQLSSSPPQSRSISTHAPVAVPSSPDPKKSTASAKDVRLGLILNPSKENPSLPTLPTPPTPVEPSKPSRSRPPDQASESSTDHQFLTAMRNCKKCGTLVSSPRSRVCILFPFFLF